jgi:hypothetical protein
MPILVNFNFKSNIKIINKYWPHAQYILIKLKFNTNYVHNMNWFQWLKPVFRTPEDEPVKGRNM